MFCSKCGTQNPDEAVYCCSCGCQISNNQQPQNANQSASKAPPVPSANVDYEIVLLAIPLLGSLLNFFWIGSLSLIQGPQEKLMFICVLVVAGTAITASLEASKLGMTKDKTRGTSSPVEWLISLVLIWVIAYPMYLYKRKYFGPKNRLIVGILLAIMFVGSMFIMNSAINDQISEVQREISKSQQELQESLEQLQQYGN